LRPVRLASAFLELLPHAVEQVGLERSLALVLSGLVLFFILERLMIWRHCHVIGHCETHRTAGHLILIGDTLLTSSMALCWLRRFSPPFPLALPLGSP